MKRRSPGEDPLDGAVRLTWSRLATASIRTRQSCRDCGAPTSWGECPVCAEVQAPAPLPVVEVPAEDLAVWTSGRLLVRGRGRRRTGRLVRPRTRAERAAEARRYRERNPARVAASRAAWRAKKRAATGYQEPKRSPEAIERRRETARRRAAERRAKKKMGR